MAFFLATNVLNDTPPEKTPCLVSSRSQKITLPFDETQPYIINGKLRLLSNNKPSRYDMILGSGLDFWGLYINNDAGDRLMHKLAYKYETASFDTWYEFTDGSHITEVKGLWAKASQAFSSGTSGKYLTLFSSLDGNLNRKYAPCALSRLNITLDDVLVADLVPINAVNTDATILLDNAEFLGYNYQSYSASLRNITPIRDTLRLRTRYLDTNGVMHYGEDYTIAISDLSAASWDVRPWTTFDDGQQVQWVIQDNKLYYQQNDLPTGAVKVFADVTVSGTQKEGGFYDTINNKYYFSETSTPLVYSEL